MMPYDSRRVRRRLLERSAPPFTIRLGAAVGAGLVFVVVAVIVAQWHWAVLAFGVLAAAATAEFMRSMQDRISRWPLWGWWLATTFVVPLVLLLFAKSAIPAEVGMKLMLLASWATFGLASSRTLERLVMRRLPKNARLDWIAAAASVVLGALGGLAVPLAAIDLVAAPRSVEAYAVAVTCNGVRVPAVGISPTVYVDSRPSETFVADAQGRVQYELPVYWDTYRMDLPNADNSGIARTEHWKQGLEGVSPEVLSTLLSFGLVRDSLDYVEGGWEVTQRNCDLAP